MFLILTSRKIPAVFRPIERIVVHCTATYPSTGVAHLVDYWRDVLGWRNVGYHFVVNYKGEIIQLSEEINPTNGARGFNKTSIHVAYVGGRGIDGKYRDTRSEAQKSTLNTLITSLLITYPEAVVVGHRDLSPDLDGDGVIEESEWIKECPLFDASFEYAKLVENVRKKL